MGQMIKVNYIGAYIDVNSEKFQEIWRDDDFYNEVGEDNFIYPYQGLEKTDILIPNKPGFSKFIDPDEEFVINDFSDLVGFEEKLKEEYAEQIKIVEKYFPDSVSVKSGLISYWDEIA